MPPSSSGRPLHGGGRVNIAPAACLEMRLARADDRSCGLCATACPRGAIALSHRQPEVDDGCIGCGQCAAVCPTGALAVDGFALPDELPGTAAEIRVDCWRVDRGDSPDGALRVPCLGGVDQGWLLALVERAGKRPLRFLDRGACGACPAGAGTEAFRTLLAEVRRLLVACGLAADALPAIAVQPPRRPLAPAIPSSAEMQPVSRRSFFRSLAGGAARAAEATGAPPPVLRQAQIAPMQRLRSIAAVQHIAGRHGADVPGALLPRLTLAECDGHGVCSRVCPTGALRRVEDGSGAALHFHAALCIACGHCTASCPERAIRVQAEGGEMQSVVVGRWSRQRCDECGERFFGAAAALCPDCFKKANLQQGMAALFRLSA